MPSADGQLSDLELEIGAFMGPHINRARIVLVGLGVLYAATGYLAYGRLAPWREMVRDYTAGGGHGPELDQLQHAVTVAYAAVVFVIMAGLANILLAAIAGKHTMKAFYAAAVIFVVHTCLQLYTASGLIFTDVVWWLTTIALVMGFHAALKAERLRKRARAAG